MVTLSFTEPVSSTARTIVVQAAMRVAQNPGAAAPTATPSPTNAITSPTVSETSQSLPASAAQGCQALSLALEPVQLDFRGVALRLDRVNLDVMSQSAGRLGTLLCSAAGALSSGIGTAERINILNNLLDAMG
jgi:hypothetical protein